MFVVSNLSQTLTVENLVQIWIERYKSRIPFSTNHSVIFEALMRAVSPEGKLETVEKLHRSLVKLNCGFAANQTRELYGYDLSIMDSGETNRIVQCAVEIYSTLLEFYRQTPCVSPETLFSNTGDRPLLSMGLGVSEVSDLANQLTPLLLEYQERHQTSDDWAKLGFLTTHLNFSNAALLSNLTSIEQIFVQPYFSFLEEQVALPWQRVCAAASTHQYSSPAFHLVRHMLPMADDIAHRVYMNLVRQFPKTTMRRGRLDHPGVRHSCLRDLNMFQAYLWLCVLQGDLAPVEDELVRLCTMVMPRVGVTWDMIVLWNDLLMREVMERTLLNQQAFLEPYILGFVHAFKQSKEQFAAEA